MFPDTRDSSPSLNNFFSGEKKLLESKHRKRTESKHRKRTAPTSPSLSQRSMSPLSIEWRTLEDHTSTSPRLGSTVKQLTPSDLRGPLIANNSIGESYPAVQLKRNLGANYNKVWEVWLDPKHAVRYVGYMTAMACLVFATFKLMGVQFWGSRRASSWVHGGPRLNTGSLTHGIWGSAYYKGNIIADTLMKLSLMQKNKINSGFEDEGLQDSSISASSISSRRLMHVEEAETLVKQWQAVKAEALGPNYQVHNLVDVLDESMLLQWKALAESAKERCCFWRFVLLQLSIIRAEILSDGMGKEMAEIEALVEEAAELVNVSHKKNPNYYSTYTIRYLLKRQDGGSWKFCEGEIQTPS